jgi:SAM-dependent methyltransferase
VISCHLFPHFMRAARKNVNDGKDVPHCAALSSWRELNRAAWDAKTPHHLTSQLYDVAGFKQGRLSLRQHEIADLAPVTGKALVHLQCHIGLDTLSWARLGAQVTGLDFSAPAIEAARALADEIGVEARFVVANVYDAPAAVGHRTYDIVYTGVGALCWLPDLAPWAKVVHDLLRPGGLLYLFEFHPLKWIVEGPSDGPHICDDYFTPPQGYRGPSLVYADASSPAPATVQWNHPLGQVVTALISAGLRIQSLVELDCDVLRQWPIMEPTGDGMYRMPADRPQLPLMYTLRAIREV